MLISFKFNNFCSFNLESEFSMEAPNSKVKTRYPDNYTSTEVDYDLLKTAVIVGENAGGKSNFIGSIKFLKSLMDSNSQVQSVGAYVNTFSFLTDKNPEQRFEICFISEKEHVYKYCLSIDSKGITGEGLYKQAKKKGAFACLFSVVRDKSGVYEKKDGKVSELDTVLKNSNNSYGLFISKLALLGNEDSIETISWFKNILLPGTVPTDQENNPARETFYSTRIV